MKYEVDGDKVKITGPQGRTRILVLREDGSLQNLQEGSLKEGELSFRKKT
jgi:hypothetical protein